MTGIIATLVLAGLAIYLWQRAEPLLTRALASREQLTQAEVKSRQPDPPTPREALPPTIRQICEQWRDPWAREQAMDYYCELHDEVKDWNVVQTRALSDDAQRLRADV